MYEYISYDYLYVKFKTDTTKSAVIEVRIRIPFQWCWVRRGHSGAFDIILVVVIWAYVWVKIHWIIPLRFMYFTVYKLHPPKKILQKHWMECFSMNTNALIIYKKNCKGILNGNTYLQILAQESDICNINPVTFPGSKCIYI